jgi:hypothetical protein
MACREGRPVQSFRFYGPTDDMADGGYFPPRLTPRT